MIKLSAISGSLIPHFPERISIWLVSIEADDIRHSAWEFDPRLKTDNFRAISDSLKCKEIRQLRNTEWP